MSFLDGLKDKAEEFGERAKDGLAAAKDKAVDLAGDAKEKASGLVEDVKDRFDGDESHADHPGMPAGEAADGMGEAVSGADLGDAAETTNASEPGQDPYDEVLEAAQDKAEVLKTDADLQAGPDVQGEAQLGVDAELAADPDLQGDPDLQTGPDLGDHRV